MASDRGEGRHLLAHRQQRVAGEQMLLHLPNSFHHCLLNVQPTNANGKVAATSDLSLKSALAAFSEKRASSSSSSQQSGLGWK